MIPTDHGPEFTGRREIVSKIGYRHLTQPVVQGTLQANYNSGGATMKVGLTLFRVLMVIAWLAMVWISYVAIRDMGASVAVKIFFDDYNHPWRAQFNSDFLVHLLLAMTWFLYRFKSPWKGILCAVLTWFIGSVFVLPFIFVTLARNGGNVAA